MGSRKIKRRAKKDRMVKVDAQTMEILQCQIQKFREKFGREPGRGDPLFFDPDSFVPRPLDLDEFTKETVDAMVKSGMRPEIVYAFRKTGYIISEDNIDKIPKSGLAEWEAAIEEYFALSEFGGEGQKPS